MWSAMDHAKVAGEVVEAVGGASNISAAAHCATRLRLVIADESKITQQALDDTDDLAYVRSPRMRPRKKPKRAATFSRASSR